MQWNSLAVVTGVVLCNETPALWWLVWCYAMKLALCGDRCGVMQWNSRAVVTGVVLCNEVQKT